MEKITINSTTDVKRHFVKFHIERIELSKKGTELVKQSEMMLEKADDMGMPIDEEKMLSIEKEMNAIYERNRIISILLVPLETMLEIKKTQFVFN